MSNINEQENLNSQKDSENLVLSENELKDVAGGKYKYPELREGNSYFVDNLTSTSSVK